MDDTVLNKVYHFPCEQWFGVNQGDGKISRDLVCQTGFGGRFGGKGGFCHLNRLLLGDRFGGNGICRH